jgi:hypothetical protein
VPIADIGHRQGRRGKQVVAYLAREIVPFLDEALAVF